MSEEQWPPYRECDSCHTINSLTAESCKQCGQGFIPFRSLSLPMKIGVIISVLTLIIIVLAQFGFLGDIPRP
jgi:hypothetical protein